MKFEFRADWYGDTPESHVFDFEGVTDQDHIIQDIQRHQSFYETPLLKYLAKSGPCGGVYIDAGANIGNHSVFFGKFLADVVIALEPDPRLACVLRRNIEVNEITSVVVLELAVGASVGHGRLWLPSHQANNAGATRVAVAESDADSADDRVVKISTIDAIVEEVREGLDFLPITLIKLDIEGMEYEALQGAAHVLQDYRPQLVVELRDSHAFAKVTTFLAKYGYCAIGRFGKTTLTYHFIDPNQHRLRTAPCDLR